MPGIGPTTFPVAYGLHECADLLVIGSRGANDDLGRADSGIDGLSLSQLDSGLGVELQGGEFAVDLERAGIVGGMGRLVVGVLSCDSFEPKPVLTADGVSLGVEKVVFHHLRDGRGNDCKDQ